MDFVEHRAYAQVLAGIPHERVTCAVVLDAMVTQVCASACDPEEVQKGSDVAGGGSGARRAFRRARALKLEHVPELSNSFTRGASRFGFGTVAPSCLVGTGTMSMERTMDDAFTARGAAFDESRGVQSARISLERDPLFPEGDVPDPLDEPEDARVTLLHAGDTAAALRSTRAPGAFAATARGAPDARVRGDSGPGRGGGEDGGAGARARRARAGMPPRARA